MPTLPGLEGPILLCQGNECLAQTEIGGAGHLVVAESIVEVSFYAGSNLPTLHLITLDLNPEAGSKRGEAEIRISVDVVPIGSKLLIVRDIGEEVLGQADHLAGVESIEIADESVDLYAGLALLCKCRKGKDRERYCNKYLFHIQTIMRKGISW